MNPFEQFKKNSKTKYYSLKNLALKSYDKYELNPYSKTRIILMNGTEFESNWFYHQFARHCHNDDVRREIARIRRVEQQQQKRISSLKPINESILETTLSYEQLAVDLTAILAKGETNPAVRDQLNFALLEDFDHLYRFTDMLEMEEGGNYKKLIGNYTEIMPGRPTIAEHRNPPDDIRKSQNSFFQSLQTKLNVNIITAAEQQTMNYYMNVGAFYHSETGRKLYSEIAMIEEQHVSGYESLLDTECTWLENMVMHEYTECYLYYSCYEDETDDYLKSVWEKHYEDELHHLYMAVSLLEKYEGKTASYLFPEQNFPKLLKFSENKKYIREVLKNVRLTSQLDMYKEIDKLLPNNTFSVYQKAVVGDVNTIPSHKIIDEYIKKNSTDLRYEIAPHPEKALQDRKTDNTSVGRLKNA